jgi:hypothetical protein
MEDKKFHQNTLTSNEEREEALLQHEIELLDACVLPNKFSLKQVEKCVVGKPQKYVVQLLPNQ